MSDYQEIKQLHYEINRLAEENARLKEAIRRIADQDATLSICGGNVKVTMDATLTDEERKAIEYFAAFQWTMVKPHASALRGLLERTK